MIKLFLIIFYNNKFFKLKYKQSNYVLLINILIL